MTRRTVSLACVLALPLFTACKGDCSDEIAATQQFLDDPAHRACQTDADCAVVYTGCHEFPRSGCGQSQVNVKASTSSEWKELAEHLDDCVGDCVQCASAMTPDCQDGSCGSSQ